MADNKKSGFGSMDDTTQRDIAQNGRQGKHDRRRSTDLDKEQATENE